MLFFSGFSLKDEEYLFHSYLLQNDFCVSGFSYGSIKAFSYIQKAIENGQRVDTLQLFSPAFFQSKDEKFKRLQLMSYKKNKKRYLMQFVNACFEPYNKKIIEQCETEVQELNELLEYEWSYSALEKLNSLGVKIEVYLGGKDAIIDTKEAERFFKEVATVTYIKEANHFLQTN